MTIITPCPSNNSQLEFTVDGATVIQNSLGERLLSTSQIDSDINRLLDEYDFIFNVHLFAAQALAKSKAKERVIRQIHAVYRALPLRYSLSLNAGLVERIKNFQAMQRWRSMELLLEGTKAVCVSKHLLQLMSKSGQEDERKLFHIPNSLDNKMFKPIDCEKKYDLLFIGRFYLVKGLDILLDSLVKLFPDHEAINLGIVGNFSHKQIRYVERRLSSVPVRLQFLGQLPNADIPRTINSSRIVTIPSRYESFSMVALEALACGVPVVGTNVGGLPELIDSSVGVLVQPESTPFSAAIKACLHDSALVESARKMGPKVAENYSWEKIGKQLLAIL